MCKNHMAVFGGRDSDNEKLNDLWLFDMTTITWRLIHDAIDPPIPRSGHSASIFNDKMLVFGGIFEVTKELNDLQIFDFTTKRWSTLYEELSYSPQKKDALNFASPDNSPNPAARYGGRGTNIRRYDTR